MMANTPTPLLFTRTEDNSCRCTYATLQARWIPELHHSSGFGWGENPMPLSPSLDFIARLMRFSTMPIQDTKVSHRHFI
jgi:hypothetical protein